LCSGNWYDAVSFMESQQLHGILLDDFRGSHLLLATRFALFCFL
jgi:hypothetical protein